MARNPNRMQEATDKLMSRFQSVASIPVAYSRGVIVIPGIQATVGRTLFDVMNGEVMVTHESRDYMMAATDLLLAGVQVVPTAGDRITESDGMVYEVAIPKPYNVYERIGPQRSVFKIHTVGRK